MGRQRLDKQRKRQDSTIYIGIECGAGLHYKLLVSIRFDSVLGRLFVRCPVSLTQKMQKFLRPAKKRISERAKVRAADREGKKIAEPVAIEPAKNDADKEKRYKRKKEIPFTINY